ncbi:hypothetical protein M758_5G025800 [Ceratodon purpureus]|nr:hypothetical protein M758_5G025800 [Ceratodon purpureus]
MQESCEFYEIMGMIRKCVEHPLHILVRRIHVGLAHQVKDKTRSMASRDKRRTHWPPKQRQTKHRKHMPFADQEECRSRSRLTNKLYIELSACNI